MNLGHRLLQAEVGVGDDQAHAAEAAAGELAQELKPELVVLSRADVDADHFTFTA